MLCAVRVPLDMMLSWDVTLLLFGHGVLLPSLSVSYIHFFM